MNQSNSADLTRLSDNEMKTIISERLTTTLSLAPQESTTYTEALFSYYKKYNIFPKTPSLLDISLRALVNAWKKNGKLAS